MNVRASVCEGALNRGREGVHVERCREGDSCENTMKASFTLFRPSTLHATLASQAILAPCAQLCTR